VSVATDFPEEYFEFEGTLSEVAVFWEEWGGAARVQQLNQVLRSLAEL
jgi:hypothetical protein